MDIDFETEEEQPGAGTFLRQAVVFIGHTVLALLLWAGLMAIGYFINPANVPQNAILGVSIAVPFFVAFFINHFRQDELAPEVWLIGLIWILIIALWVLDMPTGPNECFQCGATEKLTRTFFSLPRPSGLIDNDGPFLATWPAAALMGYALGARLALRRNR